MQYRPAVATYAFAGMLLGIVAMLIVPLPPPLLDALLALDIVFAGTVLIVSISIQDPLEFAAFAPVLLVATLFRLALDVSATRLILTEGANPGGVGALIPAFGAFVVRGNLVVGVIMFLILVTIQFVVIASGSGRVAEVAARFTLDALPGKQMAIDAELHSGAITLEASKKRRQAVQREADFFGAMDGAGKFIKGDAIAALVIVVLETVGGIVTGAAYHGMSLGDAASTYTLLAIGNALLTTLPAFLLSTAMGLLVTRVSADGSLGTDLATQLFARPDVLRMSGAFAAMLTLIPALPHAMFIALAIGAFALSHRATKRLQRAGYDRTAQRERTQRAALRRPESALGKLGVDGIAIDFGRDLLGLIRPPAGDMLLDRIGEIRRMLAQELGIVLPGVRLRDDMSLAPDVYRLRVRDEVVAEGRLRLDALLAVADEAVLAAIVGEATRDCVYGLAAKYIPPASRDAAVRSGALVFDPISILGSHLAEAVRLRASVLVGRQELQTMLDHLRSTVPALIKEIGTDRLPLSLLLRVLQALLRERIWPRDCVLLLETLIDATQTTAEESKLIERARSALVPAQLRSRGVRSFDACVVGPELEAVLVDGRLQRGYDPRILAALRDTVTAYLGKVRRVEAAVICTTIVRADIAAFLLRSNLDIPVYAFAELPAEVAVRPLVICEPPRALAAAS